MNTNPAHTVYLFPGQGSQVVGMGRELAEMYPSARQTFVQADQILGIDLSRIAWEGPEAELNDTINTQPALLVTSVAALRVFKELYPEFTPFGVAGHSMGEVSALVAAGVLSFEDALVLARTRGRLMKQAGECNPGGMVAVMGLDIPTLDRVCAEASQASGSGSTEVVQVANDNCPGQVVISGSRPALDRALVLAQHAGARRVIPLAVSIAAHSPLMESAQADFYQAVASAPMADPSIPLVGNVTAQPLTTIQQIRSDLQAQLTHRVRWTESVEWMVSQGATTYLEMGSGSVLIGLVKRIDKQAVGFPLGKPEDFSKFQS